jgi:hypothetical protein
VRLVNLTTWKKWYLAVARLLAPLCAALALLFFYDVVATAVETDTARVVAKAQRLRRATRVFIIEAKGRVLRYPTFAAGLSYMPLLHVAGNVLRRPAEWGEPTFCWS